MCWLGAAIRRPTFLLNMLFEPTGIGLKGVAIAAFLAAPSWTTAQLVLTVVIYVSLLFVTRATIVSERALSELHAYIEQRGDRDWSRATPFSNDQLQAVYGLQQFSFPISFPIVPQLYFVTYQGNKALDCRCYFNICGGSFVLTSNADKNFDCLPSGQKFVIFHEIGHASLAGGNIWMEGFVEVLFILQTLLISAFLIDVWPWWAAIAGVGGGLVLLLQGHKHFRNLKAETFSDRYGLKMISEDPSDALLVAEQLRDRWTRGLMRGGSLTRSRQLELQARLHSLAHEIRAIERVKLGKFAVDYDRLSPVFQRMPNYLWAATLFAAVYSQRGHVSDAALQLIIVCFAALILVLRVLLRKNLERLQLIEKNILEKCHPLSKESQMNPNIADIVDFVKNTDPLLEQWIPESTIQHIVDKVFIENDTAAIIAEIQTEEDDNPQFNSMDLLQEIFSIVLIVKSVYDAVEFIDKVGGVILDDNVKLRLVEHIINRLERAGLPHSAEWVKTLVDKILERITRPPSSR